MDRDRDRKRDRHERRTETASSAPNPPSKPPPLSRVLPHIHTDLRSISATQVALTSSESQLSMYETPDVRVGGGEGTSVINIAATHHKYQLQGEYRHVFLFVTAPH